MDAKKYIGYGDHGGRKPRKAPGEKVIYQTVSISGKPEQILALKNKAADAKKTVSRYVLDTILK